MVDFNRLLTNFVSESEGVLEESEDAILNLEKSPSPETIDQIFRAVHTIKGNSGLFDLPKIRELSHSMENSLNHYRNHPPDYIPESTIDLYLTTIDRLKTMIGDVKSSHQVEIQDLLSSYQSLNSPDAGSTGELRSEKFPSPPLVTSSNSKSLKIGVPKKYMELAKEENKYLALVIVNPHSIAGIKGLSDIVDFLRSKEAEGIVKVSSIADLVPNWESAGEGSWKVFFLLKSESHPQSLVTTWGMNPTSIRVLFSPSVSKVPTPEPSISASSLDREAYPPAPVEAILTPLPTKESNDSVGTNLDTEKDSYLKVSVRLIDELINLAGEAVIARNELLQKIEAAEDSSLQTSAKKIGTLFSKLQEGIMKTRLQELDSVFQKVPRIVRDISKSTGKLAELVTIGGEVELDKTLIDSISDPIMHMIRNSMDHGIESPEERRVAGKSERGLIRLSATLRGGNVIISIEDDGKGLNRDKIARKLLEKGIMTQDQLNSASNEEIFNTVFLPGFSTAEKVTTVSGRGVGMDVVRTNLKKVGGTAEISNRPEGGTVVTLTIPQTLSIVTTLLIRTCGRRYAIPEQNVKELILIDPDKLNKVETHLIYNLRDHLLPVIDLGQFLNLPMAEGYNPQYMAVLKSEKHSFGVLIDEIINPEEIVVKSLGSLFSGLSIFSGATIMGDGETVLILDIPGMAKFWSMQANKEEKELQAKQLSTSKTISTSGQSRGFLLFMVGKQQFAVPVESVPRIEKIQESTINHFQGMEVILYRDRSVPLVYLDEFYNLQLGMGESQGNRIDENLYGVFFRIKDKYTGIVANSVERVIGEMPPLKRDTFTGIGIMGYAIIEDVHTIFLDIDHLTDWLHREKFHDTEEIELNSKDLRRSMRIEEAVV